MGFCDLCCNYFVALLGDVDLGAQASAAGAPHRAGCEADWAGQRQDPKARQSIFDHRPPSTFHLFLSCPLPSCEADRMNYVCTRTAWVLAIPLLFIGGASLAATYMCSDPQG